MFIPVVNTGINGQLDNLESIHEKVEELIKEKDDTIQKIRKGLVECVVIFIDLVDSTKFKIENKNEPEKWILRVKQFGDILREYIENDHGRVVKYIGDEVMGIFDQGSQIGDALALIQRIKSIEDNLTRITGTATRVKIALDFGQVFLIEYSGHIELDPQGTPIDRCARIGKYCEPGTILSSYAFVSKCSFPKQWHNLGNVEMKGLDNQSIFQFSDETVEIKKKVEVLESEYLNLSQRIDKMTLENQTLQLDKKELISTIEQLQSQLKAVGQKPVIDTNFAHESEQKQEELDWEVIEDNFRAIRWLIKQSGVPDSEYARFLFLHQKGLPEEYNSFKNRSFDASIEKSIVVQNSDDRFNLDTHHKRNQKLIALIDQTERLIQQYEQNYGPYDEDDLFEHSFADADFWQKYLLLDVS